MWVTGVWEEGMNARGFGKVCDLKAMCWDLPSPAMLAYQS